MSSTFSKEYSQETLAFMALGVVYGDIGTSPLYALRETLRGFEGHVTSVHIMGSVSAIFWALMLIVSLKYVLLIMRADNQGEGGIMALLAMASSAVKRRPFLYSLVVLMGVIGAAFFYGDAILTPAISVLSAMEGIEIAQNGLEAYIIPVTIGILIALFAFQHKGTASVGILFGPICLCWFVALAAIGGYHIYSRPEIIGALNPTYAIHFIVGHGWQSFWVLGAVLLAFTGAEALYADMGHFGRSPIQKAWFLLVFPSLALNYFGQGALLLKNPSALQNPFYHLFPSWALYPMVVLAAAATIIASQATISGAYSMTKQAIQLGFLPRMKVLQTSFKEIGQIYIPFVNWLLLGFVLMAVVGFGSSSRLASAYGIAVSGTMLLTTFLTFFVIYFKWRFNLWFCLLVTSVFLGIDGAFFISNVFKISEGGWFPLIIGLIMLGMMLIWRRGRLMVALQSKTEAIDLEPFLGNMFVNPPLRVTGTAIFFTSNQRAVPPALLQNVKHNKIVHERLFFLTIQIEDEPWVPFNERVVIEALGNECYRLVLRFGFKNRVDVLQALTLCQAHHLSFDLEQTSFFMSRETFVPLGAQGMAIWCEHLFLFMVRNAHHMADYLELPPNRVIELGAQIDL